MGCVHSSKKKPNANGDLTANGNGGGPTASDPVRRNDSNNNQQTTGVARSRIFDVEVCNDKDGASVIRGKIEITNNSLIYRLKGRSPIIWPLRFLRSYGHDRDIFSFECGRRCPTGEGVYVFRCEQAEQLFKTLLEAINNASHLNSSNGAINNQLPGTLPHSIASSSNNAAHEYQNLSPFDTEHGNFGTLPSRLSPASAAPPELSRPHSSMSSTEQANHTYLNAAGHNVIGPNKSQPNYYTSNPLSCQSCPLDGSKTSLNGVGGSSTLVGRSNSNGPTASGGFDSSTLPQMRGTKNMQHEYVNSNVYINSSLDDSFMSRRKSSEQHLYENHEIPVAPNSRARKLEHISPRMTGSDDLSTFCYVNLDLESRKERQAFLQGIVHKHKSARTTPEPKQSYIQLDLKSKEAKSQTELPLEIISSGSSKKEPIKNGFIGEKANGTTSNGKVRNHSLPTTAPAPASGSTEESKASTPHTVPYATIDFSRTLALSNSAANHRKL